MHFGKNIFTVFAPLVMMVFMSSAYATPVTYTDRTSFEAAITNIVVDDFNSDSYAIINTADQMKTLSAGSIGYQSTGWTPPNKNIVDFTNVLCWGCNGSGEILLDDTTIGSANGVFGFGLDIIDNRSRDEYDAFVTFGDGSTQNFDLGTGAQFFALTSTDLIKRVQFGLANGGTTTTGYFQVDNVTIGNAGGGNAADVPEPAPLALLGLGLLGLGLATRRRP